jgi:glycine cleavage system T protein (aminomethyltransferase)
MAAMSVGSAFDERALGLNVRRQWREWSGTFSSSAYAPHIDIEYNAIRNAAALIDVSPLFKYHVGGPDATRLVDRVITRDASRVKPGRVIYTPWCDSEGRVIDDGTLQRLDDGSWRWTAAEGQLRWLRLNARGLAVTIEDQTDTIAALALQGPLSRDVLEAAAQTSLADLRYFGRREVRIGEVVVDVSRTGYTGDLGYEVWMHRDDALVIWDALMESGFAFALRPVGILALDVVRVEAGLIMAGVDYTSAHHALTREQSYSPMELGLGGLVELEKEVPFVGRAALRREREGGGPPRRLVGLDLDWEELEGLYAAHGLSPALSPGAWRDEIPIFDPVIQAGRATSGTWSPLLKKNLAIGTVDASTAASARGELALEWSVEGERGRISARVVDLPFFDPPRKRE